MSSELKDLKRQERQIQSTFNGAKQFFQKFKVEKHTSQIENRLELLETAMKKFYVVRRKIELLTDEDDEKEASDSKETVEERAVRLETLAERREIEHSQIIQNAEDLFCELKSLLQSLKPANTPTQVPADVAPTPILPTTNSVSRVKLPDIRLPSFGGKTSDWVTFRDMFQSLIHHNDQLNAIDKFSYLRSSLIGEALQEISSIEMSVVNYPIAWDLLKRRYENRKLIVKAHLDALFAVEPMKRENYEALSHLIGEFDRNLQMLEKVGEDSSQWSTILVHMICSRLDQATLRHWESHYSSKDVPTYDALMSFLRNQCCVLQSIAPPKSVHSETKKPKFTVSHTSVQSSNRCPFCVEAQHSAFKCQKFIKLKVSERFEMVKRYRLCLNCLSPTHLVRFCTKGFCQHCHQKHHTLLHSGSVIGGKSSSTAPQTDPSVPRAQNRQQTANIQQTQTLAQNHTTLTQNTGSSTSSLHVANANSQPQTHPPPTTDRTPSTNTLAANTYTPQRQVLLSTALIRVSDFYGNALIARALLDSCSEYCFITTTLFQTLKLPETATTLSVGGIGGSIVKSTKSVEATIAPRSLDISSYSENVQLHVLPKLTSKLPLQAVNSRTLAIPAGVILADPTFCEPGSIDLIIGAEYYYDLLLNERMKLSENGPILQRTVFGWVVSGRVPGTNLEIPRTITHTCASIDLRDLLAKFWELESCNNRSTHSVEETMCEEIFDRTTVRDSDGRFIVTLPKKNYVIDQLGDSKSIALKRFFGLEKRLAVNITLKKLYSEFIEEYLSMGHMREIYENGGEMLSYYMPHHAVIKPHSTTTKLRVVFDAFCRSSTGVSLNDGLLVGPVVQQDLLSITLRFRSHKFALVADVAKMYRMVKVAEEDQPLQRILWRNAPNEPVKIYQLTTVTYGTASAPYLATKCLQRLGSEGTQSHPTAARVVANDFYVDDLLTGTDSIEEGVILASALIDLTNSAGFNLRKWSSNSQELLSSIPSELRDDRAILELDSSASTVKTLGIIWEPANDCFRFAVPHWNTESIITKRLVLSDTARIFDPIGLIGPVIVQAKIFLQKLWKLKSDWDEPLPLELQNFWIQYRLNLSALETFSVPRWIGFSSNLVSTELHGFCDASEAAYGACLYLRCEAIDGSVSVRLIMSKSRVAPLEDLSRKKKKQSIPRLELSSALLLSHLYEKLCSSFEPPGKVYFWTDSMIVKCWLSSLPCRWQSFVANRVSEIQHITKKGVWNHIAGADNPADIISRGSTPAQLQYQPRWFEGPLWTRQQHSTWPKSADVMSPPNSPLLEEKPTASLPVHTKPLNNLFLRKSSFPDLVRMVAWIRRFIHNAMPNNRTRKRLNYLSSVEYDEAVIVLVRIAQHESFAEEIASLSKGEPVKASSKLSALNPRLVNGIIQVGGRLSHAPVSESRKHPMIIHH
ncbi:uncharacterized protein LOC131434325 [Malaya genurostris]|uniref:uncharacterized protein LOC131434325 n=1 Tax=Malaya genurostris TaxID=325434 RepID=UPI0026F3FEE8|nr:uncharacterized protein LOC131434325 [Malaya genurostris]